MDATKTLREKNCEQIKNLNICIAEVFEIINELLGKNDNSKILKIREFLVTTVERFGTNSYGDLSVQKSENSSLVNQLKLTVVKKILELINVITFAAEKSLTNKLVVHGIHLEAILNKLGYDLFSFPMGQLYDVALDTQLAVIENHEYVNSVDKKGLKNWYVKNSAFGCIERKASENKKVIEKAKVTLTDSLDSFGKRKPAEKS